MDKLLYARRKKADGEDAVGAIFQKEKSSRDAGEPNGERRDRW
jgi:hypothetical protein